MGVSCTRAARVRCGCGLEEVSLSEERGGESAHVRHVQPRRDSHVQQQSPAVKTMYGTIQISFSAPDPEVSHKGDKTCCQEVHFDIVRATASSSCSASSPPPILDIHRFLALSLCRRKRVSSHSELSSGRGLTTSTYGRLIVIHTLRARC